MMSIYFPSLKVAELRNKRMLATINRDNHEEHPKKKQMLDTNFPKIQEIYITQVSEEIEGRMTEKLSQEFSRTERCISGTLS